MKVVILSAGRASTIVTHHLLAEALVCVPESEADAYAKALASSPAFEVVTHPDSVIGLAAKHNWCFDHLEDDEGIVFFDDDIAACVRCSAAAGEGTTVRDRDFIQSMVIATAETAAELGVYLFGWSTGGFATVYYDSNEPFSLRGYVTGCAKGFVHGHGLRYDERFIVKTDFDISAMNAFRHRRAFRDLRYFWMQMGTFANPGGLAPYRNSVVEKEAVRLLEAKYGASVIRPLGGAKQRGDYAGAQRIQLRLPY